ncbi:MAG: hypothetical protein JWR26_2550 [Pedosphaera sp.]|nr:hypothetical protein [Pedosphaera sp.]
MHALLKPAICIVILVLLNGCADPVEKKVLYGQEYNRETIGFLDSPNATREETLTTLGPPFMESREKRVLLYFSETTRAWLNIYATLNPADVNEPSSSVIKRRALLISYDEVGHITGHTFRDVKMGAIQDAFRSWVPPRAAKVPMAPQQ